MDHSNQTPYETIKVETQKHVGIITLSRPAAQNSWTERMCTELTNVYAHFENDPNIRVIVMTGDPAAKVFCAGADLRKGEFSMKQQAEEDVRDQWSGKFGLAIYRSRKVTIAAINGSAAGVGITQTLPMDLRFAWADAKIIFPFVRRGILPEAGATYLLPRLIGQSRTLGLLLQSSSDVTASSPILSGLFAHLLPKKDDVLPYALKVAHDLAENLSPASVAYIKSLVLNPGNDDEEQYLLESRGNYSLMQGQDFTEGVKAFLEKRKPKFVGMKLENLPRWLPGHPLGVQEKINRANDGSLGWVKTKL